MLRSQVGKLLIKFTFLLMCLWGLQKLWSYITLAYSTYNSLDPASLEVEMLKALLDQRGIRHHDVLDHKELAELVLSSGVTTEAMMTKALTVAKQLNQASVEELTAITNFTSVDNFYWEIEDSSVWVVQIRHGTAKGAMNPKEWNKFSRTALSYGIKIGYFDCSIDRGFCNSKKLRHSQLISHVELPIRRRNKMFNTYINAEKLTADDAMKWVASSLAETVSLIDSRIQLNAHWIRFDERGLDSASVRVILVSSLDTPPLFFSVLSAELAGRVSFGMIDVRTSKGKAMAEQLHCRTDSAAYIVLTPVAIHSYGYQSGEDLSYESMSLFIRTLRPKMIDIFLFYLISISLSCCADSILIRGYLLKKIGRFLTQALQTWNVYVLCLTGLTLASVIITVSSNLLTPYRLFCLTTFAAVVREDILTFSASDGITLATTFIIILILAIVQYRIDVANNAVVNPHWSVNSVSARASDNQGRVSNSHDGLSNLDNNLIRPNDSFEINYSTSENTITLDINYRNTQLDEHFHRRHTFNTSDFTRSDFDTAPEDTGNVDDSGIILHANRTRDNIVSQSIVNFLLDVQLTRRLEAEQNEPEFPSISYVNPVRTTTHLRIFKYSGPTDSSVASGNGVLNADANSYGSIIDAVTNVRVPDAENSSSTNDAASSVSAVGAENFAITNGGLTSVSAVGAEGYSSTNDAASSASAVGAENSGSANDAASSASAVGAEKYDLNIDAIPNVRVPDVKSSGLTNDAPPSTSAVGLENCGSTNGETPSASAVGAENYGSNIDAVANVRVPFVESYGSISGAALSASPEGAENSDSNIDAAAKARKTDVESYDSTNDPASNASAEGAENSDPTYGTAPSASAVGAENYDSTNGAALSECAVGAENYSSTNDVVPSASAVGADNYGSTNGAAPRVSASGAENFDSNIDAVANVKVPDVEIYGSTNAAAPSASASGAESYGSTNDVAPSVGVVGAENYGSTNGAPPSASAVSAEDFGSTNGAAPTSSVADSPDGIIIAINCTICMEKYELAEELCGLPCNHSFHHCCIKKWLIECNKLCPICRWPADEEKAKKDFKSSQS